MRGKLKEAYDVLKGTKEFQEMALKQGLYGPGKEERLRGIIMGIETSMKVLETF